MNEDFSEDYSLEARVADYERRVRAAGGTDKIIERLIADTKRNQQLSRMLVLVVIVIIVMAMSLAGLGIVAWNNSKKIEKQVIISCNQSIKSTVSVNDLLQIMIRNAHESEVFGPEEKSKRITSYERLMLPLPECP